ncbi:hypothetical protein ABVK25_006337 [Lepraria finkii]|uniref:Uncharacterized protein n=1 Tax=Lepraria finkii TaxID=1340010 RepID=A0ABR4B7E0_9LECA
MFPRTKLNQNCNSLKRKLLLKSNLNAKASEKPAFSLSTGSPWQGQLNTSAAALAFPENLRLSDAEARGKPTQKAVNQPKNMPKFRVQAAKTAAATSAKSISPPVFDFAETSNHRPFSFTAGPSTKKVEDGPKVAFQQSTKPESNGGLEDLAQNADTEGKAHFQFDCQARAVDIPRPETHFAETAQEQSQHLRKTSHC